MPRASDLLNRPATNYGQFRLQPGYWLAPSTSPSMRPLENVLASMDGDVYWGLLGTNTGGGDDDEGYEHEGVDSDM
jgi:hypothetical protein